MGLKGSKSKPYRFSLRGKEPKHSPEEKSIERKGRHERRKNKSKRK